MKVNFSATCLAASALVLSACSATIASAPSAPPAPGSDEAGQLLPGGGQWSVQMPQNWNGTLLLWSRGFSPSAGEPSVAPDAWREALLARGYALAGSNYGSGGWALEQAVPAQVSTIDAFTARHGAPERVIGWGDSMGGLVSTALAEQENARIDGAIAMCPSIGGAVGMLNMALDGAFAFVTLQAPDAGLQVVGAGDDMANTRLAATAVAAAMQSPEGRARVALAGVLAGIPGWTRRGSDAPDAADIDTQLAEIAEIFPMGAFLPRSDQERRAGGVTSWNTGVDYAHQIELSGRRAFVEAFYQRAGLDLDSDLAALNGQPRIAADPGAVDYMLAHYTPDARPHVPLVSVQAIGDGLTSPSLQRAYVEAAPTYMVRGLWQDRAGHCGMDASAALTALTFLEQRLDTGAWPDRPVGYVEHEPAPMLRPCFRNGVCE